MSTVEQGRTRSVAIGVMQPGWTSLDIGRVLSYLGLGIGVILIGLPMYWMLLAAFKTDREIFTMPPTWIPLAPTLDNFPGAWNLAPFGRFYINTIIYTLIGGSVKLLQALF